MDLLKKYLGNNSYYSVVDGIINKFTESYNETNSISTKKLIESTLIKLNESQIPIMELKQFTTNAEVLSSNDLTVGEILKFIKNTISSGDLNFMINLAREEHIENLTRSGLPNAQDTLKDFQHLFKEPSSVIEKAIADGIFDSMESNLLKEYKNEIVDKKSNNKVLDIVENGDKIYSSATTLNESAFIGDFVMYTPVGIRLEDVKNDRMLLLTESAILSYDRNDKTFQCINEVIDIPENHAKMMNAINLLTYNPEDKTFQPTLNWDFSLYINPNGEVLLDNDTSSIEIPKEDILGLFMESIDYYKQNIPNFDYNSFAKDADNFVFLVENYNKLVNIDSLRVIKNLNENSTNFNQMIFVEPNSKNKPTIIYDSKTKSTRLFESYNEVINVGNEILGNNNIINKLFENQINFETKFSNDRNENIIRLSEEQSILNESIKEIDNLISIAEDGSPALKKLNESKLDLENKLDINLQNLNYYRNQIKLYQ